MKAIATCDIVTLNLIRISVLNHTDRRPAPINIVKRHFAALETHIPSVCQTKSDQVLHHLVLSIDGHVLTREFYEGDSMQHAIQSQVDAIVAQTFAIETVAEHPSRAAFERWYVRAPRPEFVPRNKRGT